MENFIVLDIESPNTYFSSVSSIGILVIENNKVVDKIYSLINPEEEFEDDIIELTGITPEMVKDEATFDEFWPNIKELLENNVIVGHNISYDLTVISNSLNHYNIKAPDFNYVCTLNLARNRLEMDCYGLTDIMSELNVEYNAHNALADAEVTYYLYNYLSDIKPITAINQQVFHNNNVKNQIKEEAYPIINELYGMILEFKYKDKITRNTLKIFQDWIVKYEEYSKYPLINNIILRLNNILLKNQINKDDRIHISRLTTGIFHSEKYSKEELNYQILSGILKMYNCDKTNNNKEVNFLNKWLTYNSLPDNSDINEIKESST